MRALFKGPNGQKLGIKERRSVFREDKKEERKGGLREKAKDPFSLFAAAAP